MKPRTLLALAALALATAPVRADDTRIRPTPLVPRSAETTVLDFEDGRLPEATQQSYGLQFFIGTKYCTGQYRPSVDHDFGALGTKKSLRLDVESGNFYFYYSSLDRKRYVEAARGRNRMAFSLKLPEGWGNVPGGMANQNLNIGTYLRDPLTWKGEPESHNQHHYQQLFVVPDGDWLRVVVGETPHHQRDVPGVDPAKASWRPEIPRFYDALTRFYITGVPNTKPGWSPAPAPYCVWFDQLQFYYEDERVEAHPEVSRASGAPGEEVRHAIRIVNTHPTEARRFDYQVTSRARAATLVDAKGALVTRTPLLAPGERDEVFLVERVPPGASVGAAPQRTHVLAYQVEPPVAPADPRVENRSLWKSRGDPATPAAGALCLTAVAAAPAPDRDPPLRIVDLVARRADATTAELTWTAPTGGAADPRGAALAYDVRIALEPIKTEADFERAMPLSGEPTPGGPGTRETYRVCGLAPFKKFHVAVRVEDAARNRSPVSRSVEVAGEPPADTSQRP